MRAFAIAILFLSLVAPLLGQEVYTPGNGVSAPRVLTQVRPSESGRGSVIVDCVVRANGTVGDVSVRRSAEKRLDDAAVAAVKQWVFEPGKKDGEPVAVRLIIEIRFRDR
jgi:protein TonB